MGAVIDLAGWKRKAERRTYRLQEIPVELMELILVAEMAPRHDHLNRLLDDPWGPKP